MIRDLFKRSMDKVMGREATTSSSPRSVPYPFKYETRRAPTPPAPPAESVAMPAPTPAPAPVVEAAQEPVAAEPVAAEPVVESAPVVEAAPEPVADASEDARPLEAWTVKELRAELIARGHELRSRARKGELLDLMRAELEGDGASEEAPEEEASNDNPGGLDYDIVQELFDDMVRPALQADGGDISLIRVDGMDAHVRLVGACSTCPSSVMTMKLGVEALLKEEFPGFGSLVEV